jgi:8-oxo-dGTP pyrophosphatase MutT (NUDIX family)
MHRPTDHDFDTSLATSRTPAWAGRLAATLIDNAERVNEPAVEVLRRGGRLPAGEPARAAVLVALVEDADGAGVLLTRRRDDLVSHPGQVALPGGGREAGESAEDTALREAREETALPPESVTLLGRLPRYPTTSAYMVTPVVGYVANLPPLRAQPQEVADIFIVPIAVLLDDARWEDNPLTLDGLRLPHRELHWEGQRIWGATAGMLQMFLPRLREAWEERK